MLLGFNPHCRSWGGNALGRRYIAALVRTLPQTGAPAVGGRLPGLPPGNHAVSMPRREGRVGAGEPPAAAGPVSPSPNSRRETLLPLQRALSLPQAPTAGRTEFSRASRRVTRRADAAVFVAVGARHAFRTRRYASLQQRADVRRVANGHDRVELVGGEHQSAVVGQAGPPGISVRCDDPVGWVADLVTALSYLRNTSLSRALHERRDHAPNGHQRGSLSIATYTAVLTSSRVFPLSMRYQK